MLEDATKDDPSALDLDGAELYNVREDIGETKNVAAAQRDRVQQLRIAWERWNAGLVPPAWRSPQTERQ